MENEPTFRPKILELLSGYRGRAFFRDLRAGVVVAGFALPASLAFGATTGLGPGAGLLTSVVAGFVAALFGGSRVQITGPTVAFIVVATGIVASQGVPGLVIATLLAGLLLVAFGALRLGPVLRLLPQPILVGFTAGIAVTVVVSQLRDLFGLSAPHLPVEFFERLGVLAALAGQTNLWAVGLGLATAAVCWAGDRWLPKVPWGLVAMAAGGAATAVLTLPLPTLNDAFGPLTLTVHPLEFSGVTYRKVVELLPAAFTLAFLGAVESLLSASVADALTGDRHRPNTELIGQGLGNALTAVFGGLPGTGALGRTTINVRSGGRSPVAALTHSVVLFAVWAGLGFLAGSIPLAVIAGMIVVVAIRTVDFREFRLILKTTQSDAVALATTFVVTIAVDLAFAVISGLLLAFFFFVRNMAQSSHTVSSDRTLASDLPPGTHVLDLNGAFFFGAAGKFDEAIRPLLARARTVILRMDDVSLLDATGTRVLHRLLADAKTNRVRVVMSEVQPSVLRVMDQAELIGELGTANLFASFEGALKNVRNNQPLVFATRIEEGCFDPL
jgi:SulP family sulfate permease